MKRLLPLIAIFFIFHGLTFFRPLVGHHDYINGQNLTVNLIWSRDGALSHSFVPVYTFNADIPLAEGYGVRGKNGRMYYVSYPPFIFIFQYLISKVPFVGLTPATPKLISLSCYLVSAMMLLYYLYKEFGFFTALGGFSIFSLLPVSAYMLGSVYSEDVLILPFWFAAFLLFRRLLHNEGKARVFISFFIVLFLICFTEFLGFFLSLSLLIYLVIFHQKIKWSKSYFLFFLANLLIFPLAALFLTLALYLRQIDPQALLGIFKQKLLFRTNGYLFQGKNFFAQLFPFAEDFAEKIIYHLSLGLGSYFFPIYSVVLLILILARKIKRWTLGIKDFWTCFFFFFLPPFIHFIVLNQFHYAHDFIGLYFLYFLTITFAWFFKSIEKILSVYRTNICKLDLRHLRGDPDRSVVSSSDGGGIRKSTIIKYGILFGLLLLVVVSAWDSYQKYFKEWIDLPPYKVEVFKKMRQYTDPHDLILTNYESIPTYWYYYQRNVLGNMIGRDVANFQNPYPAVRNVYYLTDVYDNAAVSCGGREIISKDPLFICKINQ